MRPTISWATLRDNSRADLRPVQFLRRYPVVWLTKQLLPQYCWWGAMPPPTPQCFNALPMSWYCIVYIVLHIIHQILHIKYFKDKHSLHVLLGEEASPILGCSIEISRDIYIYICLYVGLSTIVYGKPIQKLYAKMRGQKYIVQTCACSKSVLRV